MTARPAAYDRPGPARRTRRAIRHRGVLALAAYFGLVVALLYLPLALLFVFSVNANTSISFPLRGFTFEWYERLINTPALLKAIGNSLVVATASSIVATTIGSMLAVLLVRFEFRTRRLLAALAALPLVIPYVVLAVALLVLFRALGVTLSLLTIGVAHTVIAIPYVTLIVASRLIGFERTLEEAAMDLGASYPATLRLVVLPIAAPAIAAAWLVAFTASFDEFALALFLAGREPTFPVYLFGQLRFTTSLPVLVAAAVALMVATIGTILVAERIRRH